MKKIKIFTMSDHPLSPSGVGTQTRYIIESMLKTGKYSFVSFGGAIKHSDYTPLKPEPYGDDWTIFPVDGYGNPDMVRSLLRNEKPDIVWFMTDPRFWGWLWEMEDEIRKHAPMVYYHVWDNLPYPTFNKVWYESNDVIASISKVTHDIVNNVSPEVENHYIPHSVNTDIFKPLDEEEIKKFKLESFSASGKLAEEYPDRFLVFWNNRNARRKQSGTLIFWLKEFLDIVGKENAMLLMHTEVKDPNGQDLEAIVRHLDLTEGQVMFSEDKMPPENLSMLYNAADVTVNISDAEGFGLATLESLACGTPIVVNMTGGLQEQVTDGENWFGIGLEPSSKAIIGSQEIPWIYEDRLNKKEFIDALLKMYNMSKEEKKELKEKCRNHVIKNYNFEDFVERWDKLFTKIHEERGSWSERKNYKAWKLIEVV